MTRRERLLAWIRGGDPDRMPLLFWAGSDLPNVWFGHEREYGIEEQIEAARALGSEVWFCVHGPGIPTGVAYSDNITERVQEERLANEAVRTTRIFETPKGQLCSVREKTLDEPLKIVRDYVAGPGDVEAYKYFVIESAKAILEHRHEIKETIVRETRAGIEATRDEGPTMMWLFIPMVELTCSRFFKQEEGILFIYDQREALEEMMDLHMETTMLWIEAGTEAGVDIFGYAINGYEIYSPDLYGRYLAPQARKVNERIRQAGKLSWWHCCGRFQRIVDDGLWEKMRPDVMESYSPPPAGDVTDLARVREATTVLASRGAMYVDCLWRCDPEGVKRETRRIIEAMRGKRHMLGGTDEMLPRTPRENLIAMREAVEEAGMGFECAVSTDDQRSADGDEIQATIQV